MNESVAIIGLGMVGASLGLALRSNQKENGSNITGFDTSQSIQKSAEKLGAVDKTKWALNDAVADADMIVVATPPIQAYDILQSLAGSAKPDAVITDTLTLNTPTTEWARTLLGERFTRFVSGNPIAGNGLSGQEHAQASLFEGRRWALSPSTKARPEALKAVVKMVQDAGAKPLFIDGDEHDSFVAAMSGLPSVMATALMSVTSNAPSWSDMYKFIGINFDAASRPAAGDPALYAAAAALNGDLLGTWIDAVVEKLLEFKESITDYESSLEPESKWIRECVQAWENRQRIDAGVNPAKLDKGEPLPSSADAMGTLFFGKPIYESLARLGRIRKRDPFKYDLNSLR